MGAADIFGGKDAIVQMFQYQKWALKQSHVIPYPGLKTIIIKEKPSEAGWKYPDSHIMNQVK